MERKKKGINAQLKKKKKKGENPNLFQDLFGNLKVFNFFLKKNKFYFKKKKKKRVFHIKILDIAFLNLGPYFEGGAAEICSEFFIKTNPLRILSEVFFKS